MYTDYVIFLKSEDELVVEELAEEEQRIELDEEGAGEEE